MLFCRILSSNWKFYESHVLHRLHPWCTVCNKNIRQLQKLILCCHNLVNFNFLLTCSKKRDQFGFINRNQRKKVGYKGVSFKQKRSIFNLQWHEDYLYLQKNKERLTDLQEQRIIHLRLQDWYPAVVPQFWTNFSLNGNMESANLQDVCEKYVQLHYDKLIELSATKKSLLKQLLQSLRLLISILATK